MSDAESKTPGALTPGVLVTKLMNGAFANWRLPLATPSKTLMRSLFPEPGLRRLCASYQVAVPIRSALVRGIGLEWKLQARTAQFLVDTCGYLATRFNDEQL